MFTGVLLPVSLANNPGGDGAEGLSPGETGLVSLLEIIPLFALPHVKVRR